MVISLSKSALMQLSKISKELNKKYIFFSIKSGGCNGFKYDLKPTNNKPNKLDEIYNVKEELKNIDSQIITPLEEIHICNKSLMFVIGTNIDWSKDIMGESFIFDNPVAKSQCGCGTSFNSK